MWTTNEIKILLLTLATELNQRSKQNNEGDSESIRNRLNDIPELAKMEKKNY